MSATIVLNRGLVDDIPTTAPSVVVPVDQNKLYAPDNAGAIQGVSDVYIGPTQPLAGVKIWHDTTTMTIKRNNGTEWLPQKVAANTQDFGSFKQTAIYTGLDAIFTKSTVDEPAEVKDDLIPTMSFSRLNTGGLIQNMATETGYDSDIAPFGARFAFSELNGNSTDIRSTGYTELVFSTFLTACEQNPGNIVGRRGVVHLIDANLYFEIMFTYWGTNDTAEYGSVAYQRSTLPACPYVQPVFTALGLFFALADSAIEFNNPDYGNLSDSITPTITLKRGGIGLLYNTLQEFGYTINVSPAGAKFAFSGLGANSDIPVISVDLLSDESISPVFSDLGTACGNNILAAIDIPAVLYAEAEDAYFDIILTRWSTSFGSVGVTYNRAVYLP